MKKKSFALMLAFTMIFTFLLGACGGGGDDAADDGGSADVAAAYNNYVDQIGEPENPDGQLVVAISPDFAPMEFVDLSREGDDQYVGFDILLAKSLAVALNKELVIKPMSFDAVMAAVQTGSVDLGISGFSWTEERAENFFLTRWYKAGENESEQTVITTKANEGKFNSAEDFTGYKVGAQSGSLQKILVETKLPGAELVVYDNLNDACAALLTGKIDCLAVAVGNGESFIAANDGELVQCDFLFDIDELYKNNVILLNKNNAELGEQINDILDQQEADGVWDGWYEASQMLAEIKTADELGYDENGNKITEPAE